MAIDAASRDLQGIPWVGPSIAQDLVDLGISGIEDLVGKDPEVLFEALCEGHGEQIDRCVLYVFRSAVYYAETPDPDPELVKWWCWKDI